MDYVLYPLRYVFALIIDGQLRYGKEHWQAVMAAAMGTAIPINFLVLGILTALLKITGINIVEQWHFLAGKVGTHYMIIALLENMAIALPLVYFICVRNKAYLPIYEKVKESADSHMVKTFKGIFVSVSALIFAFFCMVLFMSR